MLSSIDNIGHQNIYYYDPLGRVTKVIFCPDTSYESSTTTQYNLIKDEEDNIKEISIVDTDIRENARKTQFDSLHRPIEEYRSDISSDNMPHWFKIASQSYDGFGRRKTQTTYDYHVPIANQPDNNTTSIEKILL
ncbi:hypothetical protein JZM24_09130 [Candidatus Sodalis endolongispinus]|uniref:Uncharacterized protein n=1 Tax=Candidatus Sodalis endolongispinus TaxID=2812662 RepID=A0ABS5YBD5_9GAMM|nr:hypothetical protein [Candidatus Sodalis endolongispinus]MBT9432246.1 hypothetical protein [Candidatus Sodalis endolongispinus]